MNTGIKNTPERFWSLVDISDKDKCWNWSGCVDSSTGYGKLSFMGKKNQSPHRIAYMLSFGAIPDGMFVCHRCDNKLCCNPFHLFAGTSDDNINDMISKKRNPRGSKVGTSKLTESSVREIKDLLKSGKYTQAQIGKMYNVKSVTITAINNERNWAWV